MNKTHFILLILMFTSLSNLSQNKIKGNKNATIIETEVNSFNKLIVDENFKVELIKGETASVEIETDENLHEIININVTDSILKLKTLKRIISSKKMNITIKYSDALKNIVLNDNAEISAANTIDNFDICLEINDNAKAFLNIKNYSFKLTNNNNSKLRLSPNCKLNIESQIVNLELSEGSKTEALITCDSLIVDMYQRADAKIEGNTKLMRANNINSTNLYSKNLTVENCEAIIEDNSNFTIQVNKNLYLEASGRTEVSVYGEPKITLSKFTEEATLHKKEL